MKLVDAAKSLAETVSGLFRSRPLEVPSPSCMRLLRAMEGRNGYMFDDEIETPHWAQALKEAEDRRFVHPGREAGGYFLTSKGQAVLRQATA